MRNVHIYGTAALGLFLFFIGVVLSFYGNEKIIMTILSKELPLRDNSEAMKNWLVSPQPILFSVYLWNVTNPDGVVAGDKPKLEEVGPYVYEQWLEKVNVREEENDTLSYNPRSRMFFSEKLSGNLRESDTVNIIHLPLVGMILRVNEVMPDFIQYLEDVWPTLFPGLNLIFLTGTVKDILFDGIPIECTSKDFMMTTICNNLEADLPKTVRKVGKGEFRFSFFNYKNGTSSDVLRIYRGIENLKKLGQTFSFNNATTANKWRDKYCDMLNGSDGSQTLVNLKPNDLIYLFQTDICRSLYAKFEKEHFKKNIKLLRFVNTQDLLASPDKNPDNHCFCSPKTNLNELIGVDDEGSQAGEEEGEEEPRTCTKNGAMLLTPCVGAPLVITFPHFYMGDEIFFGYVDVKPDKDLHQTYVDVEPLTGIPVSGRKRIQFNIEMKPIPEMSKMMNVSSGMFPALWVEESLELTAENFKKLKDAVGMAGILYNVTYGVAGLGVVLFVLATVCNAKTRSTLCWDRKEVIQPDKDSNGFGAQGVYTVKMPYNIRATGNGVLHEHPILFRRNGTLSRVYPQQPKRLPFGDDFM